MLNFKSRGFRRVVLLGVPASLLVVAALWMRDFVREELRMRPASLR